MAVKIGVYYWIPEAVAGHSQESEGPVKIKFCLTKRSAKILVGSRALTPEARRQQYLSTSN